MRNVVSIFLFVSLFHKNNTKLNRISIKKKVGKHRVPEISVPPHPRIKLSCSFHLL